MNSNRLNTSRLNITQMRRLLRIITVMLDASRTMMELDELFEIMPALTRGMSMQKTKYITAHNLFNQWARVLADEFPNHPDHISNNQAANLRRNIARYNKTVRNIRPREISGKY